MFKLLKYLKLIGLFKEVNNAYKEDTGKDKPSVLGRRFIGAVVMLVGAFLAIQFGVKIDGNILANITDSLDKVICAGFVLYGAVMEIVGIVKRKKK